MKSLIVLFVAFCGLNVIAAEHYSFKHITMSMGLSHNQINNIYRDADGFMWFSTASGLTRYDGYQMRVFLHTQDTASISDNYVEWVTDLTDSMLIGKNIDKFFLFDKHTEQFSSANQYLSSVGVPYQIDNIFVDSESDIWCVSNTSIYIYSTSHHRLITPPSGIDVGSNISDLCEANNSVYIICTNGTLLIAPLDGKCDVSRYVHKQTPVGNGLHNIFVDTDADYWLFTNSREGIWYYKSETDNWYHCTADSNSPIRMPAFVINGVDEDTKHRVWIASNHGGVAVVDKMTQSVVQVQSSKNDARGLLTNSLSCVYCDDADNVWIGSVRSGIAMYNESVFKFDIDELLYGEESTDFVPQINSIEEDANGNLWYGSNGSGLLCVQSNGKSVLYKHSSTDASSIPNDIIVDVLADSKGRIWTGSFLGGLAYFDGNKFHSFRGRKDVPQSVAADNIWAVAEDVNGNIWVGSLGSGLAMCDAKNGIWTEYNMSNSDMPSDFISQIVPIADGRLFVSTAYGIVLCDVNRQLHRIGTDIPSVTSNVNDIYVDSRGLLWVGSDNGLTVLDGTNYNQIAYFNTDNGLLHNVITGIVEDADKNMWITTTCGISNVMVSTNQRSAEYSFTLYSYDEHDGMMRGAVNVRAIKRTSKGEIIVGGNYGVARFFPNKIKYNKQSPKVIFTNLSVLGNEVGIGAGINNHVILYKAMPYTDSIELTYADNMFTISFSTLSSVLPEKVTYSYKLDGFSDKWIAAQGNSVTYTNLAPGYYTLRVRASNCDGFDSRTDAELHIRILPPWWKSTTANCVYIITLIVLITFVVLMVRLREREKYNLSQLEAEIERKSELDELKLRFFTNVSHELRTPLSLIISPLENLLTTVSDEAVKSKLEMMHRNANNLLNIVNQLLDLRKADNNAMQLNLVEGDIVSFVKRMCTDFASLSDSSTRFEFVADNDAIYTKFDKDKVAKMLSNILSNALKYTPDGGLITTHVKLLADKKSISISIADTGIGIPDEHKTHIFDRFYQVPNVNSPYGGSGIGLHMVREFVSMHGGTISVSDNDGGGSVFTIILPLYDLNVDVADATTEVSQEVRRKRIVIADDNADFRTLLNDILIDDYDVVQSKNGQEAFDKIVNEQPDIIISDVMMPIIDGNELCQKVKTDVRTSHIPFIMLTAKTADEHRIEGLANGADDYISKPFNPQILKLRVAKLIELCEKRRAIFRQQIEPEPSQITITTLDEKLIQKAVKYVEDNIASPDLSVEELSKNLGMSRVHLYKKMLAITGHTPIEFIRVIRLKRAAQMLRDKQQNVSDVAYAVGFNSPKYFSKYFKEEFGVLPSVYQNQAEGINGTIDITTI